MRLAFAAVVALCSGSAAAAPPPEVFKLANGMRAVVLRDPAVPVVTVSMIFDVGGRQEARGRSGFAHLFEHLMFEGSGHAPKGTFDKVLETYGGDNNASTHEDFTFYYEVLPANALPIALWLDADRLSTLAVTQESMKNQVLVVEEEKRLRVDNEPYGPLLYVDIASASLRNWTNSHPVIGSFEDLDAATLRDVKDFFNAYYSPANGWIAVVGDVDAVQARKLLEEYFAWIPNVSSPKPTDSTEPPQRLERRVLLEDAHAKVPALAVAWSGMPARRARPDYYALTLLGRLLASGKSARLYQSLVKEKQTAISVDGGLGFPVSDADEFKAPGLFGLFVVHKAGAAMEVQSAIYAEAAAIAKDGVGEAELARVKTKFRSDWIVNGQTTLDRATRLLRSALLDGDPASSSGELDRYMAVTAEDLRSAAETYLIPTKANVFEVRAGEKKP